MAEMTKEVIVALCKANGGYAAPHLNDQLFLHCKGFTAIQNLEPYKDVKVLWLEQNALSDLHGLDGQADALVSLFVQNNFLRSLSSLTATLRGLRVLNISHNYLTSLRGVAAACPALETLQASHNQITSLDVCEELWQLADTLTSVDLSFNRIESYDAVEEPPAAVRHADAAPCDSDDIRIVDAAVNVDRQPTSRTTPSLSHHGKDDPLALVRFFQRLPLVSVVYMHGNGLTRRLRCYRRNMILHLPALTYLDERPVFPEERRVVEAWGRGGEEMEAAERAAIRDEKRAHLTQCVQVLTEQRDSQRAMRDKLTQQFEQRRAQELEELTQRRRRYRDDRAAMETAEAAAREVVEKAAQDGRWDVEDLFHAAHTALVSTEAAHRHAYEQHVAVTQVTQEAAAEEQEDGQEETVALNAAAAVKVLEDAGQTSTCVDSLKTHFSHQTDVDAAVLLALPPQQPSAALTALLQSDDDILKEMEMEIEHVLFDLNTQTTSAATESQYVDSEAARSGSSAQSSRFASDRAMLRMERNVHAAVGHVADQLKVQQQRRRSSGMAREEAWQRFEQWEARRASLPANH